MAEWFNGLLSQYMAKSMASWVNGWLSLWLAEPMAGWFNGWLIKWLAESITGPVIGWLSHWLVGSMAGWVNYWLNQLLAESIAGWVNGFTFFISLIFILSIGLWLLHPPHHNECNYPRIYLIAQCPLYHISFRPGILLVLMILPSCIYHLKIPT